MIDYVTALSATRRVSIACCSWLVCCPPVLPADTPAKRLADRLLPRSGWPAAVWFAAVLVALGASVTLPARPGLAVTGAACAAGGGWCAVNFWRCRQAHCLITGAGWLALAALAWAGVGIGRSLLAGYERPAFFGVLAVGVFVEAATYLARGRYTLGGAAGHGDAAEPDQNPPPEDPTGPLSKGGRPASAGRP